jgi:hypothetical protein
MEILDAVGFPPKAAMLASWGRVLVRMVMTQVSPAEITNPPNMTKSPPFFSLPFLLENLTPIACQPIAPEKHYNFLLVQIIALFLLLCNVKDITDLCGKGG